MKIFGLYILTKKQKETNDEVFYDQGVEDARVYITSDIIDELERLKQDHWDKDAFDRLISLMKR